MQWWALFVIVGTIGGFYSDIVSPIISSCSRKQTPVEVSDREYDTSLEVVVDSSASVNILILPFRNFAESKSDIGNILKARFENWRYKESLNVSAQYLKDYDVESFSVELGKKLLDSLGFDIVIYGEYFIDDCISEDRGLCINYIVQDRYLESLEPLIDKNDHDFVAFRIADLLQGRVQGQLEFVILKIKLLLERYLGNADQALVTSKHLLDMSTLSNEQEILDLFLSYVYLDSLDSAVSKLTEIEKINNPLTVEEDIFAQSIKLMVYACNKDTQMVKACLVDLENNNYEQVPINSIELAQDLQRIGEFTSLIYPRIGIRYIEAACQITENYGNDNDRAKCYHDFGAVMKLLGQYDQSIESLSRAISLYEDNFQNRWLIISAKKSIVKNMISLGEKKEGFLALEELVEEIQNTSVFLETVRLYMEVASQLADQSDFESGIPLLNQAIATLNENESSSTLIPTIRYGIAKNLGLSYRFIGKYSEAEESFYQAAKLLNDMEFNNKHCEGLEQMYYEWTKMYQEIGAKEKMKATAAEALMRLERCGYVENRKI